MHRRRRGGSMRAGAQRRRLCECGASDRRVAVTVGTALWDRFVAGAGADAAALANAAGDAARLSALGQLAFRIGLSSLLLGAEDVGRLAIAIEHAIERRAGDRPPPPPITPPPDP